MLRGHGHGVIAMGAFAMAFVPAGPHVQLDRPPGTRVPYSIDAPIPGAAELRARFTSSERAILEKLNRADETHLQTLPQLVVPLVWLDDEIAYSPFPLRYPASEARPKFLVLDQPAQAFAAYERGRLVRWGPVSSGRRSIPTPSGLFHLNWRSRGRYSTVNPQWYMEWYFNFDDARGLALHSYALPGYPASHACARLLVRDAMWIHDWGEGWTIPAGGRPVLPGTPLLIVGQYDFDSPPPWRSLAHLAAGIQLPATIASSAEASWPRGTQTASNCSHGREKHPAMTASGLASRDPARRGMALAWTA